MRTIQFECFYITLSQLLEERCVMCTGFDCLLQILTNYWNLVILSLQGSGTKRQVYVYRQYLKKAICDTYFAATGE